MCEVTYDEGIVIFFADAKRCLEVKVPPTGGFSSRVRRFLHRLIRNRASLEGTFCTFVLLGDLA